MRINSYNFGFQSPYGHHNIINAITDRTMSSEQTSLSSSLNADEDPSHNHIESSESCPLGKKENGRWAEQIQLMSLDKISFRQTPCTFDEDQLNNTLIEGDCLDVLEKFPAHSVDMILCDLPYGTTQNKWDSVIDLDKLWRAYSRVIKENGAIVLTSQGIFTAKVILSNPDLFKYKLVWEKSKPTNFLNAKKQPLRKHEDVCVFYKKQPTYNPQMKMGVAYDKGIRKNQFSGSYGDFQPVHVKSIGERYPTDVVYFKTAESEGPVWHPTQKPVELARYLIRTYTNPGDLVIDNAFGSGSFLVAALLENRRFCGIEKNKDTHLFKKKKIDCVQVALQRLSDAMGSGHSLNGIKVYREAGE